MEQTFEYPNLFSGTRTGKGWTNTGGTVGYNQGTGIELHNSMSSECFIWSPEIVLHTGRKYSLSFYAASTANMSGCDIFVLDDGGFSNDYQCIAASKQNFNPPYGGAWYAWTFSIDPRARDGATFHVRFDNNGTTDGNPSLVWFRDIMLCESDVPRAWAPAAGEVWPE